MRMPRAASVSLTAAMSSTWYSTPEVVGPVARVQEELVRHEDLEEDAADVHEARVPRRLEPVEHHDAAEELPVVLDRRVVVLVHDVEVLDTAAHGSGSTPAECSTRGRSTIAGHDGRDATGLHRLPGRRRRRDGHGVHRRADRPRRRARHPRRPPLRRRAGTGRTPTRSSSSTRRRCSTAWRRPCSAPAPCSTQGPETGLQQRARRSEIQAYFDDILYRRFLGSGRVTFLSASEYRADGHDPPRHLAGDGRDGARSTCAVASSTRRTSRRRSRRRRRRRSASPTARASSPSTSCPTSSRRRAST